MNRQQMNSADAAWLHMDRPTNLMVVNSVMWFEEPIEFERVREVVRERLVDAFPRFRQRVAEPRARLGVPSWVQTDHFELDRHLHHLALPAPGDVAVLQEVVGDLISAPLDRAKPLWDMYVLDGYRGGTALLARIHHSIADGIALAHVLLSMTDERPDAGLRLVSADGRRTRPHDSIARMLGGPIPRLLTMSSQLVQRAAHEGVALLDDPGAELPSLARRAAAEVRALGKLALAPQDRDTVLRGELGAVQKVAWVDDLPLNEIKSIGHATGTTVNDVLVTALTGALRSYLIDQDSIVDQMRAMVPFNLRRLQDPLPRELGNRFGLIYLPLPVGIGDRRERLEAVHMQMETIKQSPEAEVAYGILSVLGLAPATVEQRVVDLFSTKCTLVLTNVPGPGQPVYFAGAQVAGAISWVPAGGSIGIGISIFSYDGRVTVGVRADAGLVPDPHAIVAAFERELAALTQLAGQAA